MKSILNKNVWLVLALIYTVGLLVVSLVKIESEGLSVNFKHADKIFHFGAYFGMTLIWHFYLFAKEKTNDLYPNLWICLSIIGFGIVVEIIQRDLTTYRGFEWLDILANTLGVIVASLFLALVGPKLAVKFL
ncbi:MAG TPA: VanZ family protein [Flavobacteriaceae bacterium]|nr:VanZ family protein [Flavobacteriaceae bacterium]